jgi:hypothetical protein
MRSNSREFRENRARKDRTFFVNVHVRVQRELTRLFWTVKNALFVPVQRHARHFFLNSGRKRIF